jgi:acyl-homoserine lactone acylase PvdQ
LSVRRRLVAPVVAVLAALAAAPAALAAPGDTARYILPPGNYGGLPTTVNSTDQLPLYDALTPLRGNVTARDIDRLFLPEDFKPIGQTREEQTGRPGLRLIYDQFGIPHVYGRTRADVAFGAGWTTARDRALLLGLGRGPARAAVADVPGINAFGLVTSGRGFDPSTQAEALVTRQRELLATRYGAKGRQIIADAQAYADGINAYWKATGNTSRPATVNDVIAVTAFIGSIFGAGGGGEAENADLLAKLRRDLGPVRGTRAWDDVMLADDPEAPTTIRRPFRYGPRTGGRVTGSIVLDPDSIKELDPLAAAPAAAGAAAVSAAAAPPRRQASNFLVVSPRRSRTGNSLGVMGPQLGYYYPEIVQQIHLEGPGIKAQGSAVPGLAMYILIGRTQNYAWSLTSAGHDVRDVYAERLCEPDGSAPTADSRHYVFRGRCRPMEIFDAGSIGGTPVRYPVSVHGPMIGTATVGGRPYALTRRRSTFGRDALNLLALKDMTEGRASTPQRFWRAANQFGFTFNWAWVARRNTAFFSSGLLPRRPRGLDRRLPTLGTGAYEWRGYLREREHPHAVGGPSGLLLNWNNRSAPGFMHGDDEPYGSAQRVELFDQWPRRPRLVDVVGIMNRAATEDVRSPVWPVISRVLRGGPAPNPRAAAVVDVLDDWVRRDAPRLDADLDLRYDDAGPTILDEAWRPIAETVMRPVFGDLTDDLSDVRGLNGQSGHSYVDKDLRRLLGRSVRGPFNLRYCGNGSLAACRASLWAAIDQAAAALAAEFGSDDPATWRGEASRTGFQPGLLPDTMRSTNRPTFQQVLELQRR